MPWTGKGKNVPIQNKTNGRWIIFVKTWKPQQVKSRGEGVVKFVLAKIFGWKPPLWLAFVFKKLKYVKKPN